MVSLALLGLYLPPPADAGLPGAARRMRETIFQSLREVRHEIRAGKGETSSGVVEGGEAALQNARRLPQTIARPGVGDRR